MFICVVNRQHEKLKCLYTNNDLTGKEVEKCGELESCEQCENGNNHI